MSKIDGTEKYLYELPDGTYRRRVMLYQHGDTLCLSNRWAAAWERVLRPTLLGRPRPDAREMLGQFVSVNRRVVPR